ncbi:hypothetical protein RJ55_00894 [Drechmeria coniospora]|nr:hypothetical protein RJ55_00894 [Drechmeria coniospora]
MRSFRTVLAVGLAVASAVVAQHDSKSGKSAGNPSTSSVTDNNMGPAAFMWPPDRVWSGDMDNTAPCGSRAAPGNRTKFPLTGGAVALVAQDDYYNSKISIAYSNDPTSNTDFTTLVDSRDINDLNPGHTCAKIPDAPSTVTAGTNATIQIIYKADWDAPHNQTFYACADITFVALNDFNMKIPCFNATEPGEDDKKMANDEVNGKKSSSSEPSGSGSAANSAGGSAGMSSGAMAGTIIGSLAGAFILSGAALYFYRRREQKKRSLRLARMEENARMGHYSLNKVVSQGSL